VSTAIIAVATMITDQLNVPDPRPTAIVQNKKIMSRVSLIGVRKLMMDKDPMRPNDSTRSPRMNSITTATIGPRRMSVVTKCSSKFIPRFVMR
jgi:hypothetical protein